MLHGELSNETAPGVGMRFERVIKTEEGKLNRSAKAYLQSINRLDVNLYIITTGDRRKVLAFLVKWGVPYYEVVSADSLFEIADICRELELLTYYDVDKDVLHNVGKRGKIPTKGELWTGYEVA